MLKADKRNDTYSLTACSRIVLEHYAMPRRKGQTNRDYNAGAAKRGNGKPFGHTRAHHKVELRQGIQ
jgi:hypothetical protein